LIPLNRAVDATNLCLGKPKGAHKEKNNFLGRVVASEPVQRTPMGGGEPTLRLPGTLLNILSVLKGTVAEQRSLVNTSIEFQGREESRVAQGGSSSNKSGTSSKKLNRTPKVLEHFTRFDEFGKFNSVDGAVGGRREPEKETMFPETVEEKLESLRLALSGNVDVDVRTRGNTGGTRRRKAD
jgi:hypothetical protein